MELKLSESKHFYRFRTINHIGLAPDDFEKHVKTNPYIKKVYEYPEYILLQPNLKEFKNKFLNSESKSQKIHVEIGCGSGKYLMCLSILNPNDRFFGFEVRYKRLVRAAQKLKKNNIRNVMLLRDKGEYLNEYFTCGQIDELHINFPDPWPKKTHNKHRLISLNYLSLIHPLFAENGLIKIKTDHREYFDSIHNFIKYTSGFKISKLSHDLHRSEYQNQNIETEFETMFRSKSNPPISYLEVLIESK